MPIWPAAPTPESAVRIEAGTTKSRRPKASMDAVRISDPARLQAVQIARRTRERYKLQLQLGRANVVMADRNLGPVRTIYRLLGEDGGARAATSSRTRPMPSLGCWPLRAARCGRDAPPWLKGPVKWTCCHRHGTVDSSSRELVGWLLAHRENAKLAQLLINGQRRAPRCSSRHAHAAARRACCQLLQSH